MHKWLDPLNKRLELPFKKIKKVQIEDSEKEESEVAVSEEQSDHQSESESH